MILKNKKIQLFKILFLFFILIKISFSSIVSDNSIFAVGVNNYFYFDAFDLLDKTNNLTYKILIENKRIRNLRSFCTVSSSTLSNYKISLADDSESQSFSKWVFYSDNYGFVNITCTASLTFYDGETINASESKKFLVGNTNEICNPLDISYVLTLRPSSIDYSFLIDRSFYLNRTGKKPVVTTISIVLDTSNLKGKLENVKIKCYDSSNNYPFLVETNNTNVEISNNHILASFNVYLNNLFNRYKEAETFQCEVKGFCNFFNSELSKNISLNISKVLIINPLNDSIFYLVNSSLANLSSVLLDLYTLQKYYSSRGSSQLLESFLSPYLNGLKGLLIDFVLNPTFLALGKLTARWGLGCSIECENKAPLSTCFSCISFYMSIPGKNIIATIASIFLNIHLFTSWIPLFFTTYYTTRSFPLYYLTTCDELGKWEYKYTGDMILFAVLNMGKYIPDIPYSEFLNTIKGLESLNNITNNVFNNSVNFAKKEAGIARETNKFYGFLRIPSDLSTATFNILKYPADKIIKYLESKFEFLKDIFEDPCSKGSKNSNPVSIAKSMFGDYMSIAGGVGGGDLLSIAVTPQAKLVAIAYVIIGRLLSFDDECKLKNTLAPLGFIGMKEKAVGIRLNFTYNPSTGEIEVNRDLYPKEREYDVCPILISQTLAQYIRLLVKNSECLFKYLNWKALNQIFPGYDSGDLTKILNNNLSVLILNYGNIDIYQIKSTSDLMNYTSIINIAGCTNLQKYIACLENKLVDTCKSNKWKVTGLYTLDMLIKVFVKYLSNAIVNLYIKFLKKGIRGHGIDLCDSLLVDIIKVGIEVFQSYNNYKTAEDNFKEAQKCINDKLEKLRSSLQSINTHNTNELRDLTLDDCYASNEDEKDKYNWLNWLSLLISPNSLQSFIYNNISGLIKSKINELIKLDTTNCVLESSSTDTFTFIGLDNINLGNGKFMNAEEFNNMLSESGIKQGLYIINLFFSPKPNGYVMERKRGSFCLDNANENTFFCKELEKYYSPIQSDEIYCNKSSNSAYINLTFYNPYKNCEIYLVVQKGIGNFEKKLLYSSDNCKGTKTVEISEGVYGYFGECNNIDHDAYNNEGVQIVVKGYNETNEESANIDLNIENLCNINGVRLPNYFIFKGNENCR